MERCNTNVHPTISVLIGCMLNFTHSALAFVMVVSRFTQMNITTLSILLHEKFTHIYNVDKYE